MRPVTAARRYAEAAFQVAQEDGDTSAWIEALQIAEAALSEPLTAGFFRDPNLPVDDKLRTLELVFPTFGAHVLNLLRMLVVRNRLYLVPAVLAELRALDREARGILQAEVTVARPLSDDEKSEISQRLKSVTGKSIELRAETDSTILGGVIVRVGDRLFDASVAGRLERLRQRLAI